MPDRIFQRVRWTVGLAVALAIGAMLRYPGGTPLDATTERYAMSGNFLSDLGMTVAYNHHPNKLGAGFFVASLLVLIFGLGSGLAAIIRLFWTDPSSRRWARAAAAFGFFASAAFAGVAVTPENRVMAIHITFTMWAWRFVPLAAALMALASLQSSGFRGRVSAVWLMLAVVLGGYAALLEWGPSVAAVEGLRVQVIAQKAATVLMMAALLYIAREADIAPRLAVR